MGAVFDDQLSEFKKIYKGEGCDVCNNSGYKGRIPVHEVLLMTAKVKDAIFNNASPMQIKKGAIEDGMVSLRQAGLLKLKAGLTTLEEVTLGTMEDDLL